MRVPLEKLDVRLVEHLEIDPIQPVQFAILRRDQLRPIKLSGPNLPAKPGRIFEVVCEMRTIDEEFLWHTAAQDAGATDAIFLTNGDLRTIGCGSPGGGDAAGTGANRQQIEIELCHVWGFIQP